MKRIVFFVATLIFAFLCVQETYTKGEELAVKETVNRLPISIKKEEHAYGITVKSSNGAGESEITDGVSGNQNELPDCTDEQFVRETGGIGEETGSEYREAPESEDGYFENEGGDGVSGDDTDHNDPSVTYLGVWTTTAYCPCDICCGQWATGCTASGVLAEEGRTVACGSLPFGTQLMINGHIYTVEDRGVDGEWVDIFFYSHEDALNYGMKQTEVYLVE